MGSRTRKTTPIDDAALGRVTATARTRPDSPTAVTGFADRVAGLYPVVPAWIQWLYEHSSGETAGFVYGLYYPPITVEGEITGGWTAQTWWTPERMYIAEREARKTVRARLSGHGVFAHSPDLPDDAAFFATSDRRQDWTGHWYSRDRVGAPEWQ